MTDIHLAKRMGIHYPLSATATYVTQILIYNIWFELNEGWHEFSVPWGGSNNIWAKSCSRNTNLPAGL